LKTAILSSLSHELKSPIASLRAGLIHYNTRAEVDLLVEELRALAG